MAIQDATDESGIVIPDVAQNVCVEWTTVDGAGANGFNIAQDTGSNGTVEFRYSTAKDNLSDGFAIEHSPAASDLRKATFLRTIAENNKGDGYDVDGDEVQLLCVEASGRPDPSGLQGRGVVVWGSSAHIENAYILDNARVGINGQGASVQIISSTIIDNEFLGPDDQQI